MTISQMNMVGKSGLKISIDKASQQIVKKYEVLGIYQFGSSFVSNAGRDGQKKERDKLVISDIDLLIVVRRKTIEVKEIINQCLDPIGHVVHHPDFYSPRILPRLYIEVIVVPVGAKFFSNPHLGILTGLSAFRTNRYLPIYGPQKLDDLIQLPRTPNSAIERFKIFCECQYGIKHLQAELWPLLCENGSKCDIRRLGRFFLMDVLWVIRGKFELAVNEMAEYAKHYLSDCLSSDLEFMVDYILREEFDSESNNYATLKLFELIPKVETYLFRSLVINSK